MVWGMGLVFLVGMQEMGWVAIMRIMRMAPVVAMGHIHLHKVKSGVSNFDAIIKYITIMQHGYAYAHPIKLKEKSK